MWSSERIRLDTRLHAGKVVVAAALLINIHCQDFALDQGKGVHPVLSVPHAAAIK